jgi:RNA polymerase sigma-70 factor (ECF subfamily)
MSDSETSGLDVFIQELIKGQSRVRAYILAALGNHADADDVLQRTNLVLWKKAGEFRPGADFVPWALGIARFEVLSFLRTRRRERHVFSADVALLMLDAAAEVIHAPGDRQIALAKCLERLPGRSRNLLWQRYNQEKSIKEIASETGRTDDSVKCHFLRLRKALERCIDSAMKAITA